MGAGSLVRGLASPSPAVLGLHELLLVARMLDEHDAIESWCIEIGLNRVADFAPFDDVDHACNASVCLWFSPSGARVPCALP